MSKFEQRDNSGALFRNDRKNNDKSPDYQGTVMINGVEMYIDGWLKEGNNGKFFSLAFKPKEQAQTQSRQPERQTKANFNDFNQDMSDDIPFHAEFR